MVRVSFEMSDVQHKEWFIAELVPHVRILLMQQKIAKQSEALQITMKLEDSPVGENATHMNQIQTQLENMTLQLQDIKKGKEHRKEVWCTRCRTEGHQKDQCPDF